jgi:four helix bundle protein
MNSFEDLDVWKLAHQLVLEVYKTTLKFPKEENFILKSQMLRAVISIPANIAEGNGSNTKREYIHFLVIARASLNEVKYFNLLSKDLGYINEDEFQRQQEKVNRIGMMLNKLIAKLKEN